MHKLDENFSNTQFDTAYKNIYNYLTEGRTLPRQRNAYILGGQPGSGKSNYFLDNPDAQNCIILNGDDYRKFHPGYDNIVHNDIQNMPDKTQKFCNAITERLIDDFSQSGYNMIIEGTLRNPDVPMKTCAKLKNHEYNVNLVILACDAELAWISTLERAKRMAGHGEFPRFVPIGLYSSIVANIVDNLEKISSTKCFDHISVINRNGVILYPNEQNLSPANILKSELNYENWITVFPKYSKIFDSQKKHILQKTDSIPGSNVKHPSVLQKLEKKQKLVDGQVHITKSHQQPAR